MKLFWYDNKSDDSETKTVVDPTKTKLDLCSLLAHNELSYVFLANTYSDPHGLEGGGPSLFSNGGRWIVFLFSSVLEIKLYCF